MHHTNAEMMLEIAVFSYAFSLRPSFKFFYIQNKKARKICLDDWDSFFAPLPVYFIN